MTDFPPDEAARIAALDRYAVLDTPPEQKFDRITKLARDICEAPITLISLVDTDRQWFKSRVGLEATETPRDIAFCAHTILQDDLFIVADATTDDRFRDNPLVTGHPHIRTYLGAPLITRKGYRVGTLCALYPEVRQIPDTWKEHITALAAIVFDELELQVALREAETAVSVAEESEVRFRDLVDASGEYVWETDENHRYTYHSDNGSNRRFTSSQLIGRARWELPDVKIDDAQFDDLRKTLDEHRPFRNFEYFFIDREGQRQDRRVTGTPVFTKDGNFRGYRGTVTDITHQVRIIEDLKAAIAVAEESEARFRDIAEASGEWIWETDADHRFTYVSQNTQQTVFPHSVLIGLKRWELPPFRDNSSQFDSHREVLARHEPFRHFEYHYVDENGRRQHRQISGNPVFDRDGNFTGYRGTTTDITDQIERIEDLKAARVAAEQANTAKSEFLANMSHELRTPLNAIIGFSDLMLNASPGAFTQPVYREYTYDIKKSGQDLLRIVNDILDLSKVEAGQSELNEAPVNIPMIVRTIIQRLSVQAEKADLTVSTLFADDLPFLLGDELKLGQMLTNLIANAIKFTPSHGMVTIAANFSAEDGHIIRVSDTGIGIASDDIERILAPFEQADSGLSRKYEGTGLGLPLTVSFAEMHGGSLKLISTVGDGTTVEMRFPAARAILKGPMANDRALTLDQAMQLISTQELARSCVITDPNLPDNPIVYLTPEFEKMTGYSRSEIIGRNCRFLQGPLTDPDSVAVIRHALENILPVKVRIVNYRKDGSQFLNHISIRPTLDTNGNVAAFVAVQSITDHAGPITGPEEHSDS